METRKLEPIADARDPEAQRRERVAPDQFWRAANGEPDPATNIAPPSIMQITISRMLEEQAPEPEAPSEAVSDDQSDAVNDARNSVFSTLP